MWLDKDRPTERLSFTYDPTEPSKFLGIKKYLYVNLEYKLHSN